MEKLEVFCYNTEVKTISATVPPAAAPLSFAVPHIVNGRLPRDDENAARLDIPSATEIFVYE